MTVGLNIKVTVWRIMQQPDDEIGGANMSEYRVFENLPARIESNRPNTLLLDQGLDVDESFQMIFHPCAVRERDEIEVVWPSQHRFYQKRMRISALQNTSMNPLDSRDFMSVTLRRKDYAHT